MHHLSHRPRVSAATLVLAVLLALSVVPTAVGDDWARDRAATAASEGLDPAIRTAILARLPDAPTSVAAAPAGDDGFAWGAAALGLGAGVAAMFLVLGCVTLVRHDDRLRNA